MSDNAQTVRPLTAAQLPLLARLASEFLLEFHGWRTTCDVERMLAQWQGLYGAGHGIAFGLFEGERLIGAIGGLAYQDMYDGVTTVADLGWFVRKAERQGVKPILLLRLLERWAAEHAAQRMTFTKILNPDEPVELPDYRRLGYAPRHVVYGKHL